MEYLRTFAEEYGLRDIVEVLAGRPNIQGAVLTLDDWWLRAWRLEDTGRGEDWDRWRSFWRHWGPTPFPLAGADLGNDSSPWIPRRKPDLYWRPPYWDEFSHVAGLPDDWLPLRLVVCLHPPKSSEDATFPELPRSRLPVIFDVRPLARLSASQRTSVRPVVGGISLGAGKSSYGTLGGIAEDQSGQRFAMTCAHVLSSSQTVNQPALRDDRHATVIGTTAHSLALQPCPLPGPCSPYSNSPHVTSVDTTLVQLQDGVQSDLEILSIGPLSGVVSKNSMTPGQEIAFEGRTSGHRTAEVGGLAVFYRFQIGGQTYCFRDLFEVRWRSLARMLLGSVVHAGDSGAWVCAETDQGPGWCGQVIGEDRRVGYAAFAQNIIDEWSSAGRHLQVRSLFGDN